MRLQGRIKKLESGGGYCPDCSLDDEVKIYIKGEGEPSDESSCPNCGKARAIVTFTLDIGDIEGAET